jgi:hypothetical protein
LLVARSLIDHAASDWPIGDHALTWLNPDASNPTAPEKI